MNTPVTETDLAPEANEVTEILEGQQNDLEIKSARGWNRDKEASLIKTLQQFFAHHGTTLSDAAIRDLPDLSGEIFSPIEAVSALTNSGFIASYGELKLSEVTEGMLPLLAFSKVGDAFLITKMTDKGIVHVRRGDRQFKQEKLPKAEVENHFAGYAILVKKPLTASEKKSNKGWFWDSYKGTRWLYFQVILAAAVSNFLGLSSSLFIMVVYDRVVPNAAIESLIALTIGVLIAFGFDFMIKTLRANFVDRAGQKADLRISRLIFDRLLQLRLEKRTQKSGALASVVREFDTLREFFSSATLVAVVDLPFIFFFVWVIHLISGPLYIVPLVAVPVVIILGLSIQPLMGKIAKETMTSGMSKQGALVETLNGLETVQATGSGRLMRKRYEEASAAQFELGLKTRVLSQFAINSAATVQQLAQIAIIFYGVFLIRDGVITMGSMIAAVILSSRTLAPLSQLASALSRANNAKQAYRSLNALMTEGDEVDDNAGRLSRPHLRGEVEFRNVTFGFPGQQEPIIKNLSIKIPAGQKVAILGRMGSGKSTFAKLASGLIQPTEGSVLIDGVDIRQIDKSDLRRNVGFMLQETWLFSGSLRENIQMGFVEYDDEHVLSIAKLSGVDDFAARHPQGYDLMIKERGEGLSGGQRQSINFARSLLHSPNLLVLDEPTSSMDTATEKAILERLKAWLEDRTLIAITHRNSILGLVDRVLVMDQGKVLTDTTPEQIRAGSK